jgi:hypothetical protein
MKGFLMRRTRGNLTVGILLILVGGWLLAAQFFPQLKFWNTINLPWPCWMGLLGAGLLVLGLLMDNPDMAVPATIVAGIGGILWYQSLTGDWGSWIYLWALIPGFVGIGILLAGLFNGNLRARLSSGLWLIVISLVLVTIFGFLFGSGLISTYWPIALIAVGLLILVQPLIRRRE